MHNTVICQTCKTRHPPGTTNCPKDTTKLPHPVNPPDPLVGKTIDDRYRILERLSVGGMGAVYKAEHVLMGRTVVVKVLHRHLAQQGTEGEFIQRFQREARMASQIEHPNAISIYDFGIYAGQSYLVMQYNRGRTLKAVLEQEGPLEQCRALGLLRQIGEAVAAAHKLSIIHRDLKPENIMITRDDTGKERAQVLDFGIAKVISEGEKDSAMTKTGMVLGTPYYMAPEQALAANIDARAEVYSLGVILYEMLSGRVPFKADNPMQVMMMHLKEKPAAMSTINAKLVCWPAVEALVTKAMKKEVANRYQSVNELLTAIDAALQPPSAIPHDAPSQSVVNGGAVDESPETNRARRKRSLKVVGALALVGGTLGFPVVAAFNYFSPEATARREAEAQSEHEAGEHLKQAREFARAKNVKAAVYEYGRALEIQPENANIYLSLGRLYFNDLRDDEAMIVLEKAMKLDPTLEESFLISGNIHLRRNEFQEAADAYEAVLNINPKNKDARKNLQSAQDHLRQSTPRF